jgi:hypothetical protein
LHHLKPSFYFEFNDYDAENNWYATGAKSDEMQKIFVRPSEKLKDEYRRLKATGDTSSFNSNFRTYNGAATRECEMYTCQRFKATQLDAYTGNAPRSDSWAYLERCTPPIPLDEEKQRLSFRIWPKEVARASTNRD